MLKLKIKVSRKGPSPELEELLEKQAAHEKLLLEMEYLRKHREAFFMWGAPTITTSSTVTSQANGGYSWSYNTTNDEI